MVKRHQTFRKQLFEGGFEQESDRTSVDSGAIVILHRNQAYARVHFERGSQLFQFTVNHRAHDGRVIPFREHLKQLAQ